MHSKVYLAFLILLGCSFSLSAQPKTITDFKLPSAIGSTEVALSDFKSEKGLVVIFTGNNCPYDKYYRQRIVNLSHQCAQSGLPFLLINSHPGAAENLSKMGSTAKIAGFDMPYLKDASQAVLRDFGAKKSPEAFLLKNSRGKFQVIYQGAIDNNPQVAADVKENYLLKSIEHFFAGKAPAQASVRPTGCIIRHH